MERENKEERKQTNDPHEGTGENTKLEQEDAFHSQDRTLGTGGGANQTTGFLVISREELKQGNNENEENSTSTVLDPNLEDLSDPAVLDEEKKEVLEALQVFDEIEASQDELEASLAYWEEKYNSYEAALEKAREENLSASLGSLIIHSGDVIGLIKYHLNHASSISMKRVREEEGEENNAASDSEEDSGWQHEMIYLPKKGEGTKHQKTYHVQVPINSSSQSSDNQRPLISGNVIGPGHPLYIQAPLPETATLVIPGQSNILDKETGFIPSDEED